MTSVSSIKSSKSNKESPKTPGGISKSLLTPCRRVGLSRNWKKSGRSPFVSPLVSDDSKGEVSNLVNTPKSSINFKERLSDVVSDESLTPLRGNCGEIESNDAAVQDNISTTPARNVKQPRKSRSKTLISALSSDQKQNVRKELSQENDLAIIKTDELDDDAIVPKETQIHSPKQDACNKLSKSPNTACIPTDHNNINKENPESSIKITKEKSPPSLTKECVVIVQRKINKHALCTNKTQYKSEKNIPPPVSQALFDSDSDDEPLSTIKNKVGDENIQYDNKKRSRDTNDDDDFSIKPVKVKKLEDKSTSIGGLKAKSKKEKKNKQNNLSPKLFVNNTQTQRSYSTFDDDDDDFVLDKKKTIVVRMDGGYDKPTNPYKAKTTGSITQKDIDDVQARIEMKKKLLLAKSVTSETEEIRNRIKKWNRGFQDALVELMDLMKSKFPDKQGVDYSEILKMYNIPPALVGYDEENDCFISPDDANIVLSSFK